MGFAKLTFSLYHLIEALFALGFMIYTIYLFSLDGWLTLHWSMMIIFVGYLVHAIAGLLLFRPHGIRLLIWMLLHIVLVVVTVTLFLLNTFYQKEAIDHLINIVPGGDSEEAYKMHRFLESNKFIVSIFLGAVLALQVFVFLIAGLLSARVFYYKRQTNRTPAS